MTADGDLARCAAFRDGAARFDAGAFFDAHEAWEAEWLRAPAGSPRRVGLQGLIQIAAGFHKWRVVGDADSAARLLARGADKLAALPDDFAGLDLRAFRAAIDACRAQLAAGAPPVVPRLRPDPVG